MHVYWALGGATGLAESAGQDLAEDRPGWFVALGLYGVALVLAGASVLGLLLAFPPRAGRRRLLTLLGVGVGAVLVLRAVTVEVLLLSDAGYGGAAISPAQRSWALWLWNPWFLLGGVLFGMAAFAPRPGGRPARRPGSAAGDVAHGRRRATLPHAEPG